MSTHDTHNHGSTGHGAAAHSHAPTHAVHETPPLHDQIDEWHDHSHDSAPQSTHMDVIDARAVIGIGILLFLMIAFSVVVVWWFYVGYTSKRLSEQEVVQLGDKWSPAIQARQFRDESSMKLLSHNWVVIPPPDDKTPGQLLVQIPLADAMKKVQADYFAKPSAATPRSSTVPSPNTSPIPATSAAPATNTP